MRKEITIRNRFTGDVIICGEYKSIKDCLERNRDMDLRNADLQCADLRGTDLRGMNFQDADLRDTDLQLADFRGTDLRDTDLQNADLLGTDLRGADFQDTVLQDVRNYHDSHDIFQEVIRRQPIKCFTEAEWAIIGQIIVHRSCWKEIKDLYGRRISTIRRKLTGLGYKEFEIKHKEQ